jgi:hypothetical protein
MIKNWGWGAIKERTKRKKIFQIRSPEMQTYKPTKKKIKKKRKKKKKKRLARHYLFTYLTRPPPKMSNYCTTQIGHLELERTNLTKNWKSVKILKLEGELWFPSFGANVEKMLNLLPTVHTTPLCSI